MNIKKSNIKEDQAIGAQIRAMRLVRGLTQTELADLVGVKFQQIQKYESGANRVSASRLWQIANVLDVNIVQFFEGCECTRAHIASDVIIDKSSAELCAIYAQLSEKKRGQLIDLANLIAKE